MDTNFPKSQIFGTEIVLILLEVLTNLENLGDPQEPINKSKDILKTKLFTSLVLR